jgi:glycosyltransferase involved in cell wall biosynthesis
MKISGFTFVRNAVKFDYPVVESILSILPIVDEYIVNVGKSDDETLNLIKSIPSKKIKIIESIWDNTIREGGKILREETNRALSHTKGDWCFYLQADEVIHEKDYNIIMDRLHKLLSEKRVEGILFNYLHFYGSYWTYFDYRPFYRREIRIIRNGIGVESFQDAQGFRKNNKKLWVIPIDAYVYHYGWVHPEAIMIKKSKNLDRYFHPDKWIKEKYRDKTTIYENFPGLKTFKGTHPKVMENRIKRAKWKFEPKSVELKGLKKFRRGIEKFIGHPIGEYRNYRILKINH